MSKKNSIDEIKQRISENSEAAERVRESLNDVLEALPDDGTDALNTLVAVIAMIAWMNEQQTPGAGVLLINEVSLRTMMSLRSTLAWAKGEEDPHGFH